MRFIAILACGLVSTAFADDRVRRLTESLMAEATAFRRVAPDLVSRETLQQRALKPVKKKFAPHLGDEPARVPEWQTREIVSEYGYASFDDEAESLREFRKPVSVDGQTLPNSEKALESLAASIHAPNDASKRRLLEQFEKLGLVGTVSDFGQLLLLFDAKGIDHYEFQLLGERLMGAERMLVLGYRQVDGPPGMTVWSKGQVLRERVAGQIVLRQQDLRPVKISLSSVAGSGPDAVRQEGEVEYTMTEFHCLAPVAVTHREYRRGQLTAENRFTYSAFQKFAAAGSRP